MKVYYRKGLMRGLGVTLLGVAFLLGDLFCFDDIGLNIIWSIIIMVGGICDCLRSMSKSKAKEDRIEDNDERSRFVRLVSKARSLDILEICGLIVTVIGAIAFKTTGEMVYSGVILTAGFGVILVMVVKFITAIYYDRRS